MRLKLRASLLETMPEGIMHGAKCGSLRGNDGKNSRWDTSHSVGQNFCNANKLLERWGSRALHVALAIRTLGPEAQRTSSLEKTVDPGR